MKCNMLDVQHCMTGSSTVPTIHRRLSDRKRNQGDQLLLHLFTCMTLLLVSMQGFAIPGVTAMSTVPKAPTEKPPPDERLAAVRRNMTQVDNAKGVHAFIVPTEDAHMSEYSPDFCTR